MSEKVLRAVKSLVRPAFAASVILTFAACRGPQDKSPGGVAAPSASAPSTAAATFEVQRREYTVNLHHEVSLSTGLVTTDVTGSLTVEHAASTPQTRELRLDFRGLHASARQQGNGGEGTFEGLERPAWATLATQGQPTSIYFDPDVPTSTRQLAEYVASELFHAHEQASDPVWQTTERDNSGTFTTEYRRAGPALIKRKLAYVQSRSGGRLEVDKAQWRLELSELGVPARISSEQKLRLVDLSATVTSTSRLELRATTTLSRATDWLRPPPSALRYSFGDASVQSQTEVDRQLIGRVTFEQTLEQLRQASGRELAAAMSRLAAFLRQDPRTLAAVVTQFEQGGCPPERLISPLLASGTEAAHTKLASWLEQREPKARGNLVASELLIHEAPHRVLSEALVRVGTDPTHPAHPRAAHLAGTIAERASSADAVYAATIVQRLLDAETAAPSSEARVQLLGGLGNSGSKQILTRLQERAQSTDVTVARAATAALWREPSEAAARQLDSALIGNKEPEVRLAAARACERRRAPGVLCRSLLDAIKRDTEARVRGAALGAVAASTPNSLERALKIAAKDRDESVREQAERLSSALTKSQSAAAAPSLASLGGFTKSASAAP